MKYSPILIFHICSAFIGLLSGCAALLFPKGARLHRGAGNVFFISMLGMSGSGAFMAAFVTPNMGNVMGGVLTFYLVATGWLTVIRKEAETGLLEYGLLLLALAQGAGGLLYAWKAAHSATGLIEGYPPAPYLIFGSAGLLCATFDVRLLVRRGVSGAQRISRHLLRMCLALLIAAFSFFLGKQQHFPESIRGTQLPMVPIYLIVAALIYWLIRARFSNAYKKAKV
jgi:hypothetical protein